MVDLTFLNNFTKGDPKKMRRYISLYLEVAPKTFDEMQRNLEAGDWEQLRINAHSIKPQVDFMGISSLKEQLVKIEEAVKFGNFGVVEQLLTTALAISVVSAESLKEMLDQY